MLLSRLLLSTLLAVLFGGGLASVSAQDATPAAGFDPTVRSPAHVHVGTCDDPGDVVFPLADVGYGQPLSLDPRAASPAAVTASVVGSGAFNAAAVSATTIAATLDELVGGAHAIDVHRGAVGGEGTEPETRVVCGAVGGFRSDDDLVFGLQERNGSNYGGVAWLHDNGDGTTTVFVFLVSGLIEAGGGAGAGAAEPPEDVAALEAAEAPVEVTSLVVRDGAFALGRLVLREGVPTVLHVANGDDRAYRLRTGDLVTPTPIPANDVTAVEFTSPVASTYEGELLAAEGDKVLATVPVVVAAADEAVP